MRGDPLSDHDESSLARSRNSNFWNLAGRGLWQRSEDDRARYFVMREMVTAPGDDILGRERRPRRIRRRGRRRGQGDERARAFAPFRIRAGDDRGFHDRRMAVKRLLDLERGNVFAARDDDVLGAILDLDIAVRVHDREVAGVEPAAVEALLGGRLVLQIALHQGITAQHQFADRGAVGRDVRHRLAIDNALPAEGQTCHSLPRHAPGALVDGQSLPCFLPGADRRGSIALGQPVKMSDAKPHPLHRLDHGRGWCRTAGRRLDDMVKGAPGLLRRVRQQIQHDRRAAQMRDAMLGDHRKDRRRIDAAQAETWVPATAAVTAQGKFQPLQWNIGRVHR